MSDTQVFPGSRWWRFDFHCHTPISSDFDPIESKTLTPRDWLLAYMGAGVDAVAVTDHNSAEWISPLITALEALDAERPQEWRPLTLFPGVEITAQGGLHLLAIFGPGTPQRILDGLLHGRLAGWVAGKPTHELQCAQSAADVADAIRASGGLAVAAHADKENGLLFGRVDPADNTFKPLLPERDIEPVLARLDALELHEPAGAAANHFRAKLTGRAQVAGSDWPHHTRNAGQRCTWVKMSRPDLAGLKLALLDPECALRPAPAQSAPPGLGAGPWIRRVRIENLHLRRQPLQLDFNPAYTALIGGRGSGKSTVIECLRLALGRDLDLLQVGDDDLTRTFDNFRSLYVNRHKPGMTLPETRLVAEVQIDPRDAAEVLRFEWARRGKAQGSVRVYRREGDEWIDTGLTEQQARAAFPVRIYSQKQILALAERPQALLTLIDESIDAAISRWKEDFGAARGVLVDARRKLRTLRTEIARKPALELEHRQASRKALIFANTNFGPLLKNHQRATQQLRAIDDFFRLLEQDVIALRRAAGEAAHLGDTELTGFEGQVAEEQEVLRQAIALRDRLEAHRIKIMAEVAEMERTLAAARSASEASAWQTQAKFHLNAYAQEMAKLQAAGIGSAQEAALVIAQVDRLDKELAAIKRFETQLAPAEAAVTSAAAALCAERERLTQLREARLLQVFENDASLRITLRSMGHGEGAISSLRDLLGLSERDKWPSIWDQPSDEGGEPTGVLYDATRQDRDKVTPVAQRLSEMKAGLEAGEKEILGTTIHGHLLNRVKALSPDKFDELASWFPEDEVVLSYRPALDAGYRSLAQASAGQRAAAMLSFLLAQGDEPLLFDQPEDDLDNALVSELVVARIRHDKARRQLIVVTHNANIVVNGDAELVLCMNFAGGNIQNPQAGGLQEAGVRRSICDVMEGGRRAFEQRYRRILKDLDDLERLENRA